MASSKRSRPDPFEQTRRLSHIAATEYFTDRTDFIAAFQRYLEIEDPDELRVLVFYGVGGIGKSALQRKLAAELEETRPRIPYAQFNLENIRDTTQAYREVLLRLRTDLEGAFHIRFPNFDLCLAVMLAQESGSEVPLLRINPALKGLFEFAVGWLPVPTDGVATILQRAMERFPALDHCVRTAGGTSDAIELRRRVRQNDPLLGDELIRRFALDLRDRLPERGDKVCRGVLFLDTYESLWVDREAGRASQSRRLDHWVPELAKFCLAAGMLLVICGRDRLEWLGESEDGPNWRKALDQHLIGGLSGHDAQAFLAKCGIGQAADQSPSALQQAILDCCDEDPDPQTARCHPLYLALCAEIVLNHRRTQVGEDPPPAMFSGVPSNNVANELAMRFLKSLHHRGLEMWIEEMSLTPRFDEQAALSLGAARQHNVGRADWELLTGFSFIEGPDGDGFYRLHKTMRRVLDERVEHGSDAKRWEAVHRWFASYWSTREVASLSWFHRWTTDAEESLRNWIQQHETALENLKIGRARELLAWWLDTDLDETERRRHGDQLWAWAHRAIGHSSVRTSIAPRQEVLLSAMEHCQAALRLFSEVDFPQDWALTQNDLGLAYVDLPTGDRGENLRRAIDCYEAALRVLTEVDFPQDWALTQNYLGIAYASLPTGDRNESQRLAIEYFHASLRVYIKEDFPQEWALTQNNLGLAYRNLRTGDGSENLWHAVDCFRATLGILGETEFPQSWATAQNNLGLAYAELPTGDCSENLRLAIEFYEAALRVRTEGDFPEEWAQTQDNLAYAYSNLPTGDRGENLRRAIDCYQAALRVRTKDDFPLAWATTQNNLGLAYWNLPSGDRNENLRRAIECYQAAQRVYTQAHFPWEWASAQNNLGLAHCYLGTGDRSENLRLAIEYHQSALQVFTEADFPQEWATSNDDLGNAYQYLLTKDRGKSLRRAIDCHKAALRVRTESAFPVEWARTQNNLGSAYRDLPAEEGDESVRRAIECYQAALRVFTEEKFPQDWAFTQNNWGLAYADLRTGDQTDNLRHAIECYEAALRVYTEDGFPRSWAMTQTNLGISYLSLPTGDRDGNVRQAIECFKAALRIFTESNLPWHWAATQNNLALAYSSLPSRDHDESLRQAIACCEDALRVYNATDFPQESAEVTKLVNQLRTDLEAQAACSD